MYIFLNLNLFIFSKLSSVMFFQFDALESPSDSDFDSDDISDVLSDHHKVDVNGFLGRAVAIWLYTHMDSITLFVPKYDESLTQVMHYIEHRWAVNCTTDKFMVLEAGEKVPRNIMDAYQLTQGSVIMVLPKRNLTVHVEINQLDFKFPINAEPTCTVYEVKTYIKRVKGIAINQQDILFNDKVLENCRRLYEYKIKTGTTMHVLIQVHFDILLNVETFWGKTYRIYVDRCSTGSDILYRVFGRTFSNQGKERVTVHELFVPILILILTLKKLALHWDYCLGFYGIKSGDTLVLNTVGRKSEMNMQTFLVVTELGENFEVTVSQFDRWSVVAFIAHGHTDVPVDLIRLYRKDVKLDFTEAVGLLPKSSLITMNITMTNLNKDMMIGIPLKINIGNGIIENMKVAPTKKVSEVKDRLEGIGVPNATLYELGIAQFKLPNHAKLIDVIKDFKKTLFLKVEKFPVFLHSPDGVIYKTNIDVNHSLKDLQYKIELKSGHAISSCRLLMSGQELQIPDNANLYNNGISSRNSIFVETAPMFETFFITSGQTIMKLRVPVKPTADIIKRSVWAQRDLPENSITCLQTFLFWFFGPRMNKKSQLPKKRHKRKKLLPAATEPLHILSERGTMKPKERLKEWQQGPNVAVPKLRKSYYSLPPLQKEGSDEDARTWPISLQRPVKPQKSVQNWINATYYQPRVERRHIRTPTRKQIPQSHREDHEPREPQFRHPSAEKQHLAPRWVSNLKDHDRKNLLEIDTNGTAYRSKQVHYPTCVTRKRVSRPRQKAHQQGDATSGNYFNTRRMFDKQEMVYESDDDSMMDEDKLYNRSYVVLK